MRKQPLWRKIRCRWHSRSAVAALAAVLLALGGSHAGAEPLRMADIGSLDAAGGRIERCVVGYRTYGALAADRSNAVLIPTWLTGRSADLEALIGSGKLLDPDRFHVIAVDSLGDGVSCSPSNSARQPRIRFPAFGIPDMVESQHRLVTRVLGIPRLHAVVGISMGGMQAIEWASSHPEAVGRAVSIVGTPQPTSQDLLTWTAEMRAIADSADWRGGGYRGHPPFPTLAAMHALALGTPAGRAAATPRGEFSALMRKTDADTLKTFEAVDWYRQLGAMTSFDGARRDGGALGALARRLTVPMLFVTSEQDHLVDPGPARILATAMQARLVELRGDCGHLAPVCELDKVTPAVADFLR